MVCKAGTCTRTFSCRRFRPASSGYSSATDGTGRRFTGFSASGSNEPAVLSPTSFRRNQGGFSRLVPCAPVRHPPWPPGRERMNRGGLPSIPSKGFARRGLMFTSPPAREQRKVLSCGQPADRRSAKRLRTERRRTGRPDCPCASTRFPSLLAPADDGNGQPAVLLDDPEYLLPPREEGRRHPFSAACCIARKDSVGTGRLPGEPGHEISPAGPVQLRVRVHRDTGSPIGGTFSRVSRAGGSVHGPRREARNGGLSAVLPVEWVRRA